MKQWAHSLLRQCLAYGCRSANAHDKCVGAQVAEATWCGPFVRHESLRGVLAQLHRAVQLLHGSVQQLLQQVAEQTDMLERHRHVG